MKNSEQHDVGTVIITMCTADGPITHIYPRARAMVETRYPEPAYDLETDFTESLIVEPSTPAEVVFTLNPFPDDNGNYLFIHDHTDKEIPNG